MIFITLSLPIYNIYQQSKTLKNTISHPILITTKPHKISIVLSNPMPNHKKQQILIADWFVRVK